jgi:hypothetical protein
MRHTDRAAQRRHWAQAGVQLQRVAGEAGLTGCLGSGSSAAMNRRIAAVRALFEFAVLAGVRLTARCRPRGAVRACEPPRRGVLGHPASTALAAWRPDGSASASAVGDLGARRGSGVPGRPWHPPGFSGPRGSAHLRSLSGPRREPPDRVTLTLPEPLLESIGRSHPDLSRVADQRPTAGTGVAD